MSRRPTVTATHHIDYDREELRAAYPGREPEVVRVITTPGVLLEVTFDLHDHDAALAALWTAYEDVRDQIRETDQ